MKVVSLIGEAEQVLVGDDDQCVDVLLELGNPAVCRAPAAGALEGERLGDHADGQDALVARRLGDDRRCSCAGATPHAGRDKAHVRAFERLLDVGDGFLGRRAPDLRTRTRAETLGDLEAELDAAIRGRGVERLCVGVGNDKIDALHVGAHHVGDGVAARPADADHADPRAKFVDLGPDEIDAHVPKPPPNSATR